MIDFLQLFESVDYDIRRSLGDATWFAVTTQDVYSLKSSWGFSYVGDDLDAIIHYADESREPFLVVGMKPTAKLKILQQRYIPKLAEIVGIPCPDDPSEYYTVLYHKEAYERLAKHEWDGVELNDDHSVDGNMEAHYHTTLALRPEGLAKMKITGSCRAWYNPEGGYDYMGGYELFTDD